MKPATAARSRAGIPSTADRIHATSRERAAVIGLSVGLALMGRAAGSGQAKLPSGSEDSPESSSP